MFRSITSRLTVIHVGYLFLLSVVIAATVLVLRAQETDSLVLNLSGRQRMLTQRMTHQLLTYASLADQEKDTQAQRALVVSSMQVFERTLSALSNGGPAPLDLQLVNTRETPRASHSVLQQLQRVSRLYDSYRFHARRILDAPTAERQLGVNYVVTHNGELLSEMNTAVNLMQSEAELRVRQLYLIQGGALGLALIFSWLLSGITRRTVVEPLRDLSQASEAMSRGLVHRPIVARGPVEIHELGSSFERLRVAMKNLMSFAEPGQGL